jgi:gamma-glutamyl:cysteine ligase YbdK (ATP-grasp superfamily)
MEKAAKEIFAKAAPSMKKLGTSNYLSVLQKILATGTSSTRQRKIFNAQNSFSAIIKELHPKFWQ